MSDAVSTADYQRLLGESMKRKEIIRDLKRQLAERDQRLAALAEERDQLAAGFEEVDARLQEIEANPDSAAGRVAELERTLLERDHRDAFRGLYDDPEIGLNKSIPVDKLIKLLDHQAEGAPDVAQLKAKIAGLRESDPYLFAPPQSSAQQGQGRGETPPDRPKVPAGPGHSRGDRDTSLGGFTVRRSDTADAGWMQANQDRLAAAVKDGSVRWVD